MCIRDRSFTFATSGQRTDSLLILKQMQLQQDAWNKGDLKTYMSTYWKSDSLMFIGKTGVTYGWENTLRNYERGYPDTSAMGKLQFNLLKVKKLSKTYFFILGKWHLTRSVGDIGGHFTLLFKRIKGKWLIVSDHSS